jgi:hypothetical protein
MAVFIGLSFILSRAAVAATGSDLDSAQKWLVYPSLLIVYVLLAAVIIAWAPITGGAGGFYLSYDWLQEHSGESLGSWYYPYPEELDVHAGIFAGWTAIAAAGVWWSILAVLLLFDRPRKLAAVIFAPFLTTIRKKWTIAGLVLGLLLLLSAALLASMRF